jgi:hypothetical protein
MKNMNIVETNICGHIHFRVAGDLCDKCGEEKINIMMFGEVCVNCDKPKNLNELISDEN